jgi:hypothetical protein
MRVQAMQVEANKTIAGMQIDANLKIAGMQLDKTQVQLQLQDKLALQSLQANTFSIYASGINQYQTSQMEPDAKIQAINNWNAMFAGNPWMPPGFKINLGTIPTTPAAAPPPAATPPVDPGTGGG